jgi:hypothetical protein
MKQTISTIESRDSIGVAISRTGQHRLAFVGCPPLTFKCAIHKDSNTNFGSFGPDPQSRTEWFTSIQKRSIEPNPNQRSQHCSLELNQLHQKRKSGRQQSFCERVITGWYCHSMSLTGKHTLARECNSARSLLVSPFSPIFVRTERFRHRLPLRLTVLPVWTRVSGMTGNHFQRSSLLTGLCRGLQF